MPSDTFVIVPAYNEGRVLRATLDHLLKSCDHSVVVVDDGSKDDTWAIIREFPVFGLRHPVNLGQGAAVQTGMTFALQEGAEYLVLFDADGQHRPADIERMTEPLRSGEADVVLGSRFLRPEDRREVPPLKRLLLRAAVVVEAVLTGLWLSDAHNGFRALSRAAAARVQIRENRFAYASDMLRQVRKLGLRYVERPTTIAYTEYSTAKGQSMWNALNIVVDMMLRRIFR